MIKLNNQTIKFGTFPNGETYADIQKKYVEPHENKNEILFKFENDTDIFHLICVKNYVDENWPMLPCDLIMPYVPYSRMDRQEEERLFTLKTFANIINSMNFTSVEITEPHSEVTPALINRVKIKNRSTELALYAINDCLKNAMGRYSLDTLYYDVSDNKDLIDETKVILNGMLNLAKEKGIYIVYPDAGAEKRYSKQLKYPNILTCSKTRDFNTGNINSIVLKGYENATNCKTAIIIDDLCSKGGTFSGTATELYKHLPNLKKVILCVAHCENKIFEGDILSGKNIDKVYTTYSILNEENKHDKLIVWER